MTQSTEMNQTLNCEYLRINFKKNILFGRNILISKTIIHLFFFMNNFQQREIKKDFGLKKRIQNLFISDFTNSTGGFSLK